MSVETFDPVSLEILWTRLVSIVDEAAATFVRTSFSTLARESNDYAVVLTDSEGRSLAQSTLSIPSFIGTLPATVKHALAHFPLETLRPGDAMITNDPWQGTGHIHDINIVVPIFYRGSVVAFAALASHLPDIGGRLRNSGVPDIFEEGLQIPMLKLLCVGDPNATLVSIIEQNVRVPEQTMGDIWGAVAACEIVGNRLVALIDESGASLAALGRDIRARSEHAMRESIRKLPPGEYRSTVQHDGFEVPIVIRCTIRINGDTVHIDYTGSSPQIPRAVNVVPIYTFAYSAFAIKALLSPDVPNNEGSVLPITTVAPLGSILNPVYPAASGARGPVGHMLPPTIMLALAEVIPSKVLAPGSGNCGVTIVGHRGGRSFAVSTFVNGGQGAAQSRDGWSATSFPSNMGNTPIEVLESQAPVRVIERSFNRASGGAGKHRGGDGIHFEFEVLEDETTCSFIMTRLKTPPSGILGGSPGRVGRLLLNGNPIDPSEPRKLRRGDRVLMETAGGGGFGT